MSQSISRMHTPTGINMPAIPNGDARRALPVKDNKPFYENLRQELRTYLSRKQQLDKSLRAIEDNIYRLETAYLEETPNGNIIRGFDNYIKGNVARRRNPISDSDRLFSRSSVSFQKDQESSQSGTPVAATPVSEATPRPKDNKKKKRKKGDEGTETPSGDEAAAGTKRVRVSFSTS